MLSINGRIGRLRYLAWSMVLSAATLMLVGVCLLVMNGSLVAGGLLMAVVLVAFAVIGAQIGVQRLHDLGWSGWLLLLTMVPFVGSVFPFLMILLPGTKAQTLLARRRHQIPEVLRLWPFCGCYSSP